MEDDDDNVRPIDGDNIRSAARALCKSHHFDSVIVIGVRKTEVYGGTWGFPSDLHLRDTLCSIIHASYARRDTVEEEE